MNLKNNKALNNYQNEIIALYNIMKIIMKI
jgi:hypothetical protein